MRPKEQSERTAKREEVRLRNVCSSQSIIESPALIFSIILAKANKPLLPQHHSYTDQSGAQPPAQPILCVSRDGYGKNLLNSAASAHKGCSCLSGSAPQPQQCIQSIRNSTQHQVHGLSLHPPWRRQTLLSFGLGICFPDTGTMVPMPSKAEPWLGAQLTRA